MGETRRVLANSGDCQQVRTLTGCGVESPFWLRKDVRGSGKLFGVI